MTERDNLITALMTQFELDESSAESVIDYAKSLSVPGRKSNDFALSKALNERTADILNTIGSAYRHDRFEATSIDLKTLNKCYVLIVDELKRLYGRNDELASISPSPAWHYLDILENAGWEISEYIFENQNDGGRSHTAQVNKLCILSGKDDPEYIAETKQLLEATDKALKDFQD